MSDLLLVYTLCKDTAEAKNIAKKLLDDKLAACCNIVKEVESLYFWEGKQTSDQEVLLLIKTSRNHKNNVFLAIENIHSYDIPAIIAIPFESNLSYENWVNSSLNSTS